MPGRKIHAYMHTCIHAYMHTCIHAYMHTCIHAYMHTCIHAYMHTCIHAYMHTCIHAYMHTCIHAYMHTCIHAYMHTCIHAYMHTCIHAYMHTCIHAYMHTCIHAYMHTCIHAYMHTCIHAYMHTCIHAYMHTCIHAYMHTCIHAYMHTCIHAYMHTYIHTYIQTELACATRAARAPREHRSCTDCRVVATSQTFRLLLPPSVALRLLPFLRQSVPTCHRAPFVTRCPRRWTAASSQGRWRRTRRTYRGVGASGCLLRDHCRVLLVRPLAARRSRSSYLFLWLSIYVGSTLPLLFFSYFAPSCPLVAVVGR